MGAAGVGGGGCPGGVELMRDRLRAKLSSKPLRLQPSRKLLRLAAMLEAHARRIPTVLHVHDSQCAEVPEDDVTSGPLLKDIMMRQLDWARGLPINAELTEGKRYTK